MMPRLIALDLDGTLTQHRTPLEEKNRRVLEKLAQQTKLLMVGAGTCQRIFDQMGHFPIDIIGNYGMQYAEYEAETKMLKVLRSENAAVQEQEIRRRAAEVRRQFGLENFYGDTIEIHPTGMLTFSLVGTKAPLDVKLSCDPDRSRRRAMYSFVKELFCDYSVIIGGSSSFDMIPGAYGKCNALRRYLREHGLEEKDILYIGDDYEQGGGDHDVYAAGMPFLIVDHYENFEKLVTERIMG